MTAQSVTKTNNTTTIAYIGNVPELMVDISLLTVPAPASAKTRPTDNPPSTHALVVPRTFLTTLSRLAPNASRRAISFVRCDTRHAITLYMPHAAIRRAKAANTVTRTALKRGPAIEFENT